MATPETPEQIEEREKFARSPAENLALADKLKVKVLKKLGGKGGSESIQSFEELNEQMTSPFEEIAAVLGFIERHLKMLTLCEIRNSKAAGLISDDEVKAIYDTDDADNDILS